MTVAESIKLLIEIIGKKSTPEERRPLEIELTGLLDIYRGNSYNEHRWNLSEAYHYRAGWERGREQAAIQGMGDINHYMKGASCDKPMCDK